MGSGGLTRDSFLLLLLPFLLSFFRSLLRYFSNLVFFFSFLLFFTPLVFNFSIIIIYFLPTAILADILTVPVKQSIPHLNQSLSPKSQIVKRIIQKGILTRNFSCFSFGRRVVLHGGGIDRRPFKVKTIFFLMAQY